MLGAYLSLFLGLALCFTVKQIYNQTIDLKEHKVHEPPDFVNRFFILRIAFRFIYSRFCQLVIMILRVLLCIVFILLFLGYMYLRSTEWGDLFN